MAVLLLLLAIIGGALVGDLVVENLARRDPPARRLVATAVDHGPPAATARRVPSPPADRQREPVYEEARRAARLRGDPDLSFLWTDHQARA